MAENHTPQVFLRHLAAWVMIYSLLHTLGSFYIDPVRKVRLQFVSCGFSPKQAQMVQTKEANTPLVCTIKYLFVKTLFDIESATSKYPTSKKGEFCGAQLCFHSSFQLYNQLYSESSAFHFPSCQRETWVWYRGKPQSVNVPRYPSDLLSDFSVARLLSSIFARPNIQTPVWNYIKVFSYTFIEQCPCP